MKRPVISTLASLAAAMVASGCNLTALLPEGLLGPQSLDGSSSFQACPTASPEPTSRIRGCWECAEPALPVPTPTPRPLPSDLSFDGSGDTTVISYEEFPRDSAYPDRELDVAGDGSWSAWRILQPFAANEVLATGSIGVSAVTELVAVSARTPAPGELPFLELFSLVDQRIVPSIGAWALTVNLESESASVSSRVQPVFSLPGFEALYQAMTSLTDDLDATPSPAGGNPVPRLPSPAF